MSRSDSQEWLLLGPTEAGIFMSHFRRLAICRLPKQASAKKGTLFPGITQIRGRWLLSGLLLLLLPLVVCGAAVFPSPAQNEIRAPTLKDGELLIKWKGGPGVRAAAVLNAKIGSTVLRNFRLTGWQHVQIKAGFPLLRALAIYSKSPFVQAVEPNYRRPLYAIPNDPSSSQQWALDRISAPAAWDLTTGKTNVVVAVIDSGVNYLHEDLAPNMWRNPGEIPGNGIDDDGNGYVDDVYGIDPANHDSDPKDDFLHGTACAGILGAAGNNSLGGAGVCWSVRIMALKSHGSNGNGYDADIIECFEYAVMMKRRGTNLRVTSNSYGGNENGRAIKDAIDLAGTAGIVNVWSAGNDHSNNDYTPRYPQSFDCPSILAVAASDERDTLASFSNFGEQTVDLAAPGSNLFTTDYTGPSAYRPRFTGTSAACPLVAGAAALLCAANPSLTAPQIKSALIASVDFLPWMNGMVGAGGRLNVARALLEATAPDAPPIVLEATPAGNRALRKPGVTITFSKPMDRPSVEAAFALNPAEDGYFAWSNADQTVEFVPFDWLKPASSYVVRLAATAADLNGQLLDGNGNRHHDGGNLDDFSWSFRVPPLGDDFATAEWIEGADGESEATNLNATREPGEPTRPENDGGASIWFRWVAPANGPFTFETSGSAVPTVLAVYQGESLRTLKLVFADDNCMDGSSSRATFVATEGRTYSICVDGKTERDYNHDAAPMGAIRLHWAETAPPKIESVTPAFGLPGYMNINGHHFLGATNVAINGRTVAFTNKTDTRIRIYVPDSLRGGIITVSTVAGGTSNEPKLEAFETPPVLRIEILDGAALRIQAPGKTDDLTLQVSDSLHPPLWRDFAPASTEILITNSPELSPRYFRLIKDSWP